MTKPLSYYLNLPYGRIVTPDSYSSGEICYLAQIPELQGCESHGETPEEALENLWDAMELYVATALEDGVEIPEPEHVGVSAIWRTNLYNMADVLTDNLPVLPVTASLHAV